MRVSVIVTTYEQPVWLEKALWGWATQTRPDFELLVADDGSGPETADVVERARERSGLRIRHVWHADRGHRKSEILNRAILESEGEYLIFSDGDCVPRWDLVEVHLRLAEPARFLSGGTLRLPMRVSERLQPEDIRSGRAFRTSWLRSHGWRPGRRAVRLLTGGTLPTLLDVITPTRASWNGHNASTWRAPILAVNGFEAEMGYGGQDRAFGERLENLGLRGKQIRHRAPCLHLEHERPYATEASKRRNAEIRRRIRRWGEVRARQGLRELAAGRVVPEVPIP